MTQKFSAARKRAFLNFLTQTGNQTLSAERAKVSRSWVRLHRSTDPSFDAECREAIAVAGMMLVDDGSPCPDDPRWRRQDGLELVVRKTRGRRLQVGRSRIQQWSPKMEERFCAELAASCNVKASCRAIGMGYASAYAHRKRWPDFARRWDEALSIGAVRLEAALIEGACAFFDPELPPPEVPIADMSVMGAVRILRMYERRGR